MNLQQYSLLTIICLLVFFGCSNQEASSALDNPATEGSQYPYLFSTQGGLYMSWITTDSSDIHSLKYARYADNQWSTPETIASDSGWFVNWADFPSVIADSSGPIAAHWLNKKPGGTYAYDVNISITDSQDRWQPALVPHNDNTATEHGFVSMIPWDQETFLLVWLDGRRSAERADDEYYDLSKAMTLRGALVSDDGTIKDQFLIDESVCDCCQTSLVKTKSGAAVAYRNRTDEEIRDIYISRFNGETWDQPQAVYDDEWEIGACPVNGPKIVADDSLVAVAWHTDADTISTSQVAISSDGGNTFTDPIRLSKEISVGRVGAEIDNQKIYVSWMEKEKKGEQATLELAIIGSDHKILKKQTISTIDGGRKSGFPQMQIYSDKIYFAWTTVDAETTHIATKSIPLSSAF